MQTGGRIGSSSSTVSSVSFLLIVSQKTHKSLDANYQEGGHYANSKGWWIDYVVSPDFSGKDLQYEDRHLEKSDRVLLGSDRVLLWSDRCQQL